MGIGANVGDVTVPILMFADDMVLMAEKEEELQALVEKVKEYCDEWKLEINVGKTKVMVVSKDGSTSTRITYGTEMLECVREFTYLGTVFTADGKWEKEVERRTQAGRAALGGISKQVVWNRTISVKVKKVLFSPLVKSRLTYGGDVWWPSKAEMGKLETV